MSVSVRTNPLQTKVASQTDLYRRLAIVLTALALIYAFCAGLRTVGDPDTGWQIATGRWIVQHHSIPQADVLSHTAAGREWIYPALSQVIFYLLYKVGGFSLLSWFSAVACVFIIVLLSRENPVTTYLAVLLIPLVADRTVPRAELFTEVCFTLYVVLLWRYHQRGRGPLWLLPVLMLVWVNTHLGFAAGFGACGAFVLFETEDYLHRERRATAVAHLRFAVPWIIATFAVTTLNPWALRNYIGMFRLAPVQANTWVYELNSVVINASTASKVFDLRDPRCTMWLMMAIAIIAALASLMQKRIAPALVLGASLYLVIHSIRFQTLFGIVVVVFGGAVLADLGEIPWVKRRCNESGAAEHGSALAVLAVAVLALLACVRVSDLVTNRHYVRTPFEYAAFGPGEANWYPSDAAAFVKRERLPGNIFNDYNVGGFVAWQLGPEYPDYIDGRGTPFGGDLFFRSQELLTKSLDAPEWRHESESRHINTIFVSLDFELGNALENLSLLCDSQGWRPVFLDTRSAVFVRVIPETAELIRRYPVDCKSKEFNTPPAGAGFRSREQRFRYYRNAAAILSALNRASDALHAADLAEQDSPDNPALHYIRGVSFQKLGDYRAAEREVLRASVLEPSEVNLRAVANVYKREDRFADAALMLKKAIERSTQPHQMYVELGFVDLTMGLPQRALQDFENAEKTNPFPRGEIGAASEFYRYLDEGEVNAWLSLADLYDAHGNRAEAMNARRQAKLITDHPRVAAPTD